jgi:uncharacterized protein (DUF934 family)
MLIDFSGKTLSEDKPIVLWQEWCAQREDLIAKNEQVVLAFPNDEDVNKLRLDLTHFKEIILSFPLFKDGKAYSQARILREELGFTGILRARGDVLLDQAFFMRRCGFSKFEISDDVSLSAWQKALDDFSVSYQPTNDAMATIWELRSK